MTQVQLKKATITDLDNPETVIGVLFNPNEYTFERTNSFKEATVPGLISPLIQFVNGESDHLSMELFMDDYTDPSGPTSLIQSESQPLAKRLKALTGLMNVNRELHAPPRVRFNWGPMEFTAVIEKLTRKVSMFHPDGTPSRVSLSVSFKEYRTLREQLSSPRRESSDKTKRREIVGSDQLWRLADREYGSPNAWVHIAIANDLDDPRDIRPGDWLVVPPLEGTNATR